MKYLLFVICSSAMLLSSQGLAAQDAAAPSMQPQPPPAGAPGVTPGAGPVAQPEAAAAKAQKPMEDEAGRLDESDKCLLDKFCIGPVLTFGAVNVLGIGIQTRYDENWGFGLDYQFLPSVGTEQASASLYLFTLDARWYPTSAFFLSGGFALQGFSAEAMTSMTDVDPSTFTPVSTTIRVEGSVTVPMLKLGLGLLGGEGFVMGIDLAVGVPLGGTDVDFSINSDTSNPTVAAEAVSLQNDVQEYADLALEQIPVLLQVNLLRIGYIF